MMKRGDLKSSLPLRLTLNPLFRLQFAYSEVEIN